MGTASTSASTTKTDASSSLLPVVREPQAELRLARAAAAAEAGVGRQRQAALAAVLDADVGGGAATSRAEASQKPRSARGVRRARRRGAAPRER
jgi:hypothetical protein